MEWLTDKVCWFPDHRVLINWAPGLPIQYGHRYVWQADLVLGAATDDPACLMVHKDRHGTLFAHENTLNQIFEEYEMDAVHFRGRVFLTQSELTRWQLMLC
jgi:hypothetical protein